MATEKRLIDANEPLKQLSGYMEKLHCSDDYRDGLYRGMEIAESYIKNAPTVDAVEVVRCEGCKHWKFIDSLNPHWECQIFCGLHEHGYPTNADDFCSYGERKDNER